MIIFTIIIFVILKLSFAFAKYIYIILTLINKYFESIKIAKKKK